MTTTYKITTSLLVATVVMSLLFLPQFVIAQDGDASVVATSYTDWDDPDAVAALDEELNSIYMGEKANTNIAWEDRTDIQEFLDAYSGPLKSYEETYEVKQKEKLHTITKNGAEAIVNSGMGWGYNINTQLLVTLLELKWDILTDQNSSIETYKTDMEPIRGITR